MRTLSATVIFLTILLPAMAISQIPNADFENWTGGEPDGWVSSNNPLVVNVTQSTIAHHGLSAVSGVTAALAPGFNLGPVIQSGPGGHGFAINQRYATLKGWYQFTGVGGDLFAIDVVFGPVSPGDTGVAVGAMRLPSTSGWTQFTCTMIYYFPITPDTAAINFSISGPVTGSDVHLGSSFLVDDIGFVGTTDVPRGSGALPTRFALEQNYPNPFNPYTSITFALPGTEYVRLAVYDILGREVALLVNEKREAGRYEVGFNPGGLGSGVYFYRLTAGDRTETRRMMLLK